MSHWNTVAIYGVGLIGGSIGLALRQGNLADQVVGIGRNPQRLQVAVECGAINEFCTDLPKCPAPDLVILCAPVQRLVEHGRAIFERFPESLITDAGSTKRALVETIEAELPQARFIGSHPMAGSEKSGVEFARADLFSNKTVILTPTEKTDPLCISQVTHFWEALGARICTMNPVEHDEALAIASHVPHVIASALASETPENVLHLIAGGWRDTTRIAAADVDMWTQILLENSSNIRTRLDGIQARLQAFQTALDDDDQETISRLLTAGKQRRDALGS